MLFGHTTKSFNVVSVTITTTKPINLFTPRAQGVYGVGRCGLKLRPPNSASTGHKKGQQLNIAQELFPQDEAPKYIPSTTLGVWAKTDNTYMGAAETVKALPRKVFESFPHPSGGIVIREVNILTDFLISIPGDAFEKVFKEFHTFWESKEKFKKYGFVHKRGFLLYGPPGSGKTSIINLFGTKLESINGIMLLGNNPGVLTETIKVIRSIEPECPVIVVLEDLDEIVLRYGTREILNLLDGEFSPEGVLFVATTNYPEKLPPTLINRPARLDTRLEIPMPSAQVRRKFIELKIPTASTEEINELVIKSQGLSLAHLRELAIGTLVFNHPPDEIIKTLKSVKNTPDSAKFSSAPRVGLNVFSGVCEQSE